MGELRHLVDGQEHEKFALGQAKVADVDMDVADGGFGEALALCDCLLGLGQAGDAVALQALVESIAAKLRG